MSDEQAPLLDDLVTAEEPSEGRRSGRRWRVALVSVVAIALVLVAGTAVAGLWMRHRLASNIDPGGSLHPDS